MRTLQSCLYGVNQSRGFLAEGGSGDVALGFGLKVGLEGVGLSGGAFGLAFRFSLFMTLRRNLTSLVCLSSALAFEKRVD